MTLWGIFFSTLDGEEYCFYNTFFLKLKHHLNVKYKKHILPLHVGGNHWILGIVDEQLKKVIIVDSLTTGSMEVCNSIFKKIKRRLINGSEEFELEMAECSKQTDSTSCGIFCCINAERVVKNQDLTKRITKKEIGLYRQVLASKLYKAVMFLQN